jgi:hypothetical protein
LKPSVVEAAQHVLENQGELDAAQHRAEFLRQAGDVSRTLSTILEREHADARYIVDRLVQEVGVSAFSSPGVS